MIVDKLANACGHETIHLNSRITKIFHNGKRILRVEINGRDHVPVENVISTLPLSVLVRSLEPKAPPHILDLINQIHFQNLILVALFLKRERVTANASLYFPDADIPFTRAYEPKNRSPFMAPPGHTSLIVEIPCGRDHALWTMDEQSLIRKTSDILIEKHLIAPADCLDSALYRIPFAYPVLELGFESVIRDINAYLDNFENLRILGRSGRFEYTHIHDLMAAGQELIESELPTYQNA
jgi:protoporphyrinogen oxidase